MEEARVRRGPSPDVERCAIVVALLIQGTPQRQAADAGGMSKAYANVLAKQLRAGTLLPEVEVAARARLPVDFVQADRVERRGGRRTPRVIDGEAVSLRELAEQACTTANALSKRLQKADRAARDTLAALDCVSRAVLVARRAVDPKEFDFWRVYMAERGDELVVEGRRLLRPNRAPRIDHVYRAKP